MASIDDQELTMLNGYMIAGKDALIRRERAIVRKMAVFEASSLVFIVIALVGPALSPVLSPVLSLSDDMKASLLLIYVALYTQLYQPWISDRDKCILSLLIKYHHSPGSR
jgi:hypothetical protein